MVTLVVALRLPGHRPRALAAGDPAVRPRAQAGGVVGGPGQAAGLDHQTALTTVGDTETSWNYQGYQEVGLAVL